MEFSNIIAFLVFQILFSQAALSFEVVAHRGVHQNYSRVNLSNETCTAGRIEKPTHSFLENTLTSIEQAFVYGADIVEVDIHPTTEPDGSHEIVVFHDWTLECRTNASCKNGCNCSPSGECVTHVQSLSYLQSLDIGFGYTHDGKIFPFRGNYNGQMPNIEDVISLLERHPHKKVLINLKDNFPHTLDTLIAILESSPFNVRSRVLVPRYFRANRLIELGIPDAIYQSGKAQKCLRDYLATGWLGAVPQSCRGIDIFVPTRENLGRIHPSLAGILLTEVLWGWPETFITLMNEHGSKVYASQIDTLRELERYREVGLSGIMTNRIELIGPAIK